MYEKKEGIVCVCVCGTWISIDSPRLKELYRLYRRPVKQHREWGDGKKKGVPHSSFKFITGSSTWNWSTDRNGPLSNHFITLTAAVKYFFFFFKSFHEWTYGRFQFIIFVACFFFFFFFFFFFSRRLSSSRTTNTERARPWGWRARKVFILTVAGKINETVQVVKGTVNLT